MLDIRGVAKTAFFGLLQCPISLLGGEMGGIINVYLTWYSAPAQESSSVSSLPSLKLEGGEVHVAGKQKNDHYEYFN
jgi:hypothetical protein